MGSVIQTLTVAISLLIVGLTCIVIGVAGLMWKTGRDRRREENAVASDSGPWRTDPDAGDQVTDRTAARRR